MKIRIELNTDWLNDLIDRARIGYWADGFKQRDGLSFMVRDGHDRGRWHRCNPRKIKRAIYLMIKHAHPEVAAVLGNEFAADSNTGDALIQYAIFGECRYG